MLYTPGNSKGIKLPSENVNLARLYRGLKYVRRVEERVAEIYPSDKIKSPVHLSIGQEAASVAVCDVLENDDYVSGTYRGHALYLAKGGSLNAMLAEMYGKSGGAARGKGGSMHLCSRDANVLGASAVVGTNVPISLGAALSMKMQKNGRIVACFFGDGSTEEGAFAESLNFAALKKLPILFVCENNFYAIHEPLSARWATDRLCERVETYGIPATLIDDDDVLKMHAAASAAVDHVRSGKGPAFIEYHAYRLREHVGPNEDYNQGYRGEDEAALWRGRDQVARLADMIDADERTRIDAEIEVVIEQAVEFAENSPAPAAEELYSHVYAD
jgi:pyruvate dehydrogenase E1 component alpha subunit